MRELVASSDFVELVEKLSGRTVEAFFSDIHIDPDYSVEFFLLEPLPDTMPTFSSSHLGPRNRRV